MKQVSFHKEILVLILGLILPCKSIFGQITFDRSYTDFLIAKYSSDTSILNLIHFAGEKIYQAPDSSLAYGKLVLKIMSDRKYFTYESEVFELMGKSSDIIGARDSAKYWFEKSLVVRKIKGDSKAIAQTYYHLGVLMRRSSKYEEALNYYAKGIEFSHEGVRPPTRTLANLYSSLGLVYGKINQDERALVALNRGLEIRKAIGDSLGIGTSNLSIGNFYAERKNYSLAEDYLQKSIFMYSKLNYQQGLFRVKNSLANILYEQGRYTEALRIYEEVLKLVDGRGDLVLQASLKNNIGSVLNEMKQFREAMDILQDGLNTMDDEDDLDLALSLHQNLSKALYQSRNITQAYAELEKALVVQSSIIKEKTEAIQRESDNRLQIEEEALQIELEKEQALAKQAQIELANRNLVAGIIIGVLLLLLGIGWMMSRLRIRRRRLTFENRIDRLLHQQEEVMFGAMIRGQEQAYSSIAQELHDNIGMLLSATNLHFSSLEEKLDSQLEAFQQAKSTLLKAVKEVRTLSRDMLSGTLHHLGLVESIENVLKVVKQTGQYTVSLDLINLEEAEIPPSITHAVYRSIQELLSNVIKHAHATHIDVQLAYQEDELILVFKDNGIGIQINPDRLEQGMGLKSIQSRITDHQGICQIERPNEGGTKVLLRLPLPASKSEWVANHSQNQEP